MNRLTWYEIKKEIKACLAPEIQNLVIPSGSGGPAYELWDAIGLWAAAVECAFNRGRFKGREEARRIVSPPEHSPGVEDGTDQCFDESAPAIEGVIADLGKDVPLEAFDNVVADPAQERRDLIAIRDAAIVLVKRLEERDRDAIKADYGFDPAMTCELELHMLKAMINAQHYPDTHN